MGDPSVEGLRVALLDGALSVRRWDAQSGDPNARPPLELKSIEVRHAKYMGRVTPFQVRFSHWLNAIVGGRGTGKSTLIEFLRIALRRERELEKLPTSIRQDFSQYVSEYSTRNEPGLLTDRTEIRVVYRRDAVRFRIQWSTNANLNPIERELDNSWSAVPGDINLPIGLGSATQDVGGGGG